ncbi:WecB/TagA/CpsF family glycosyltransferase [Oceanobacillus bengalensis]|uniref:N-acetylglucosaminyldiphosphoundecaprenol N-acetyl-beta-D-mannosaminyltransferase n=1 Tax=Oceanobacillus bengalensis TaxID=1435466 RepID=A0A494YZQ8_9BACI|nr:WecB/TagA/CpsF family glycosyltransferase [Oceanobacillus bengalensis]RKQ15737.1 glycosyltransferase [Oceanobacillus bengalensis]
MKHVTIMGIPFIHTNQKQFVSLLVERIAQRKKTFVITANPEIVMKANEEPEFMDYVQQADYVTADGIGIVKAAQILNNPLPERVTGFDTMMQLLSIANERRYRIFLLGAQTETLEQTIKTINEQFPDVEIVGSNHGFFDWDNNDITNQIQQLQPDITFVALGVPRQEKWISENISTFGHGIFIGIGGSFDVLAGTVKRAPDTWVRLNLEWLYRLINQPSRWRRMLALPRFAFRVYKQKWRGSSI